MRLLQLWLFLERNLGHNQCTLGRIPTYFRDSGCYWNFPCNCQYMKVKADHQFPWNKISNSPIPMKKIVWYHESCFYAGHTNGILTHEMRCFWHQRWREWQAQLKMELGRSDMMYRLYCFTVFVAYKSRSCNLNQPPKKTLNQYRTFSGDRKCISQKHITLQLSVFMNAGSDCVFLLNAGHVWRTSRDLFLHVRKLELYQREP